MHFIHSQQFHPETSLQSKGDVLSLMLTMCLFCTQYEHWTQILGHQPNKRRQQ